MSQSDKKEVVVLTAEEKKKKEKEIREAGYLGMDLFRCPTCSTPQQAKVISWDDAEKEVIELDDEKKPIRAALYCKDCKNHLAIATIISLPEIKKLNDARRKT